MRPSVAMTLLAMTILIVCPQGADQLWGQAAGTGGLETYSNQQAGFEALMPPDPQYKKAKQGEGPDEVQHQFVAGGANGVYLIAYQDHPHLDVSDPKIAEVAYVAARDGFLKAVQGERTVYKEITLDGVSGREMGFTMPAQKGEARSRMFFANKRWYHVLVMGTPDFVKSESAAQFLDSFHMLDPATGKRLSPES